MKNTHGRCTEASLCSQIIEDYERATGNRVKNSAEATKILNGTKVDIRNTSNKSGSGTPKKACDSCAPTMSELGVNSVNN